MIQLARSIVLSCVIAAATAQTVPCGKTLINDIENIDNLNRVENSTWVAGVNERFANMTYDDVRHLFGAELTHISEHLDSVLPESHYESLIADADLPTEYNSVTAHAGLVHPIRDQQRCGSCWAFSAAETLGDRLAIATGKASSPVLSPEDMVSCDKTDQGCQGGRLPAAWAYLKGTGIVSDQCFPYGAGSGTAPACPSKCANGEDWTKSKVKAASSYAVNGVANMQKEILAHGPIQVAFKVYKSFMTYKSGVYSKHFWELMPEGGHAVKIVGWGEESVKGFFGTKTTPYWLVANSWNTSWGLDGYFKIKRGGSQCGIETMGPPYAGMPVV